MEYMILVPRVSNKPEHQMDPSEYDVSTIQMDFFRNEKYWQNQCIKKEQPIGVHVIAKARESQK